jgi:hypothetical protein
MGCGSVVRTVVRIAVPAVVSLAGGAPLAVAISAAAATGATGGSFTESLTAGATSFIGQHVARGVTGSFTEAAQAAQTAANPVNIIGEAAPFQGAFASAAQVPTFGAPSALAGTLTKTAAGLVPTPDLSFGAQFLRNTLSPDALEATQQPILPNAPDASGLLDPVREGIQGFADIGKEFTQGLFGANRTPFDAFLDLAPKSLSEITPADVIGKLVGFSAESTLNDVLLAPPELSIPALEAIGFEPEAIEVLRNEARIAQLQDVFDDLEQMPDLNPGVDPEEFTNILGSGVQSINRELGPEITQAQFDDVFADRERLGRDIIRFEEEGRREEGRQDVRNLFADTRELFNPTVDDDIISSILDEKQGEASAQVARFQARGNLNPTGGRSANVFFEQERPEAERRASGIGEGILGQARETLGGIEARGIGEAGRFQLGRTPDFDIAPFREEREQFIDRTLGTDDTPGTLGADIRGALGTDQLFDFGGAVREAGAQQGLVSGAPSQQALLDQFAARGEGFADRFGRRRDTRGLGSAGAF